MGNTAETKVLREVAGISSSQYGLARRLLEGGVASPEALEAAVERVVRDRLRLAKGRLFLAARLAQPFSEPAQQVAGEEGDAEKRRTRPRE